MEQIYSYPAPSRALQLEQGCRLLLAASAGLDKHPRLFDGQLRHPRQAALALLCLAWVARTSFLKPSVPDRAGRMSGPAVDPIVTCDLDRLDLEALSPCSGVYVRLELMPSVLVGTSFGSGQASLDLNLPVRAALAKVGDRDQLQVSIGPEDLALSGAGAGLERHLTIPPQWPAAFARARQLSAASPVQRRLPAYEARRFTRSLDGFDELSRYSTGLQLQACEDERFQAWRIEFDGLLINMAQSQDTARPFGVDQAGPAPAARTYAWWEAASKVRVMGSSD